jgi:hypothetical protein
MGSEHVNQRLSTQYETENSNDVSFSNFDAGVERIYVNCIPDFVESTLLRLYENVYCTLARISAYDSLKGISTYVRLENSVIKTVILFRINRRTIDIVSQQIKLAPAEICSFAKLVFLNYPVATVRFQAIDSKLDFCPYPFLQKQALEENVILLPPTKDIYMASLRSQFRKQILTQEVAIRAKYPGFKIKILSGNQIDDEVIGKILSLASKRMASKGSHDYTTSIDRDALGKIFRKYGYVALGVVDEEVCGGAMWLSVGARHFHQIAAHDPQYDEFTLGSQLWLAAILHCIELGGAECWLMGGASGHKAKFLAKVRELNEIVVFKSKVHLSLCFRLLAKHWYEYSKTWLKKKMKAKLSSGTVKRKLSKNFLSFFDTRR